MGNCNPLQPGYDAHGCPQSQASRAGARLNPESMTNKGSVPALAPIHKVSVDQHAARMRGHEIIVELGHNRKLMAAMKELDERPESLAEAIEDGNKFLKKRRVKLPAGTTISVKKRAKGWEMNVRVDEPRHFYKYRYNSDKGLIHR